MRIRHLTAALLTITLSAASPAISNAQSYDTSFGGAGYSCFNSAGASQCVGFDVRPISYTWHTGDYYRQSISGSGLSSVNGLSFNLNFTSNLNQGANMTFAVFVNGQNVGTTQEFLGDGNGDIFMAPVSFAFSAISAPVYEVELRVSSPTIAPGDGSLGLYTDGASTIQLTSAVAVVPEPSTYALFAAGLVGIAGAARVRRRRAA